METLSGIIAFVRTAEAASFVAAGRALGVSASAVGKSVAKLEESVKVRLFHRTTRRIALTAEGQLFYARCRRILDDLDDAESMLSEAAQTPRGTLRVSLPAIGYRFLVPALPGFLARHPEIDLDLDCNDRHVDLVEDRFDVVIRSGDLPDSGLMAQKVGDYRFALYAAPLYCESFGVPDTPADLGHHRGLRFRFPTTGQLQDWEFRGKGSDPRPETVMVCNNMEALRAAAIEGLGIAHMPTFLAKSAIEEGTLRTVLENYPMGGGRFVALWSSSRHLSPKIRVFIDFLRDDVFVAEPTI